MNTEVPYLPTFFFFSFSGFFSFSRYYYCRIFCDTVMGEVYIRSPARYIGRWRDAKEGGFFAKKKGRKNKKKR